MAEKQYKYKMHIYIFVHSISTTNYPIVHYQILRSIILKYFELFWNISDDNTERYPWVLYVCLFCCFDVFMLCMQLI